MGLLVEFIRVLFQPHASRFESGTERRSVTAATLTIAWVSSIAQLGFVFNVEIVLDPKHANDDDDYPAPPDDGNTTYCNERDLADVVGAWWGSFARWHDPNPPSSMMKLNPSCIVPSWPPFNSSNGQTEHFSQQSLDNYLYIGVSSAEQRKGIKDDKCDFWKEMAPIPVSAVFGDLN